MIPSCHLFSNTDVLTLLCDNLLIFECVRLSFVSRSLYAIIQNNSLIWKQLFSSHWREQFRSIRDGHFDVRWREAVQSQKKQQRDVLKGKWMEFDGYFIQSDFSFIFSMVIHCSQDLLSLTPLPDIPDSLIEEDVFCLAYDTDPKTCVYPRIMTGPMNEYFVFPPPFDMHDFDNTEQSIEIARYYSENSELYMFFNAALPSELFRLKQQLLSSEQDPSEVELYFRGNIVPMVPVQGVINWTMQSESSNSKTAQEFVMGYYNRSDRMLYMAGIGRTGNANDANLGCDVYRLQVSEDGQSFEGRTLGNEGSDIPWSARIMGGSAQYRRDVGLLMKDRVLREIQQEEHKEGGEGGGGGEGGF
jgi:hypothetical protein